MNIQKILKESKLLQAQKEDEHSWQKIDANILNLASTIKKQDVDMILTTLQSLITRSILSERSKVSGTALVLLKACINYNPSVDLSVFVDPLFKLCGRSNRVFSMRGEEVLLLLADKINRPMAYFKEYSVSVNKNIRLCAFKTMEVFLRGVFKNQSENMKIDEQVNSVLLFVESGILDAHYECRVVCKRILKEFRGSDVEIREEKGPVIIRRPNVVVSEKRGALAAFGQRAKAAIELIGRYSPFRKQAKNNESKSLKIEKEILDEETTTSDPVKNLIKMTEVIQCDAKNNHTPKRLQDYIDKYKDHSFVDKKYLETTNNKISEETTTKFEEAKEIFDIVENSDANIDQMDEKQDIVVSAFDNNDFIREEDLSIINIINSDNNRKDTNNDLIFKTEPNSSVLEEENQRNMKIFTNSNLQLNEESVNVPEPEIQTNLKNFIPNIQVDEESVIVPEPEITVNSGIYKDEILCNEESEVYQAFEPETYKKQNLETTINADNHNNECSIIEKEDLPDNKYGNNHSNIFSINDYEKHKSFMNQDELSIIINENQVQNSINVQIDEKIDASINKLSIHENTSAIQSLIKIEENNDTIIESENMVDNKMYDDYTLIGSKVYAKREDVVRCEEKKDDNVKSK